MANYRIEIKRSAAKELTQLPAKDRERIVVRIQALADDPRPAGVEKLSDQNRYRIRQGNYRIRYEIMDQILCIYCSQNRTSAGRVPRLNPLAFRSPRRCTGGICRNWCCWTFSH